MDVIKYKEFTKLLESNNEVRKKVYRELLRHGYDKELKGFYILMDLISLSFLHKKHSYPAMQSYFDFIGKRYNLKVYSVQRAIRYSTLKAVGEDILPSTICFDIWEKLVREERERKEHENQETENHTV